MRRSKNNTPPNCRTAGKAHGPCDNAYRWISTKWSGSTTTEAACARSDWGQPRQPDQDRAHRSTERGLRWRIPWDAGTGGGNRQHAQEVPQGDSGYPLVGCWPGLIGGEIIRSRIAAQDSPNDTSGANNGGAACAGHPNKRAEWRKSARFLGLSRACKSDYDKFGLIAARHGRAGSSAGSAPLSPGQGAPHARPIQPGTARRARR